MMISSTGPSHMAAKTSIGAVAVSLGRIARMRLWCLAACVVVVLLMVVANIESTLQDLPEKDRGKRPGNHQNDDTESCAVAKARVPEALHVDQIAKHVG